MMCVILYLNNDICQYIELFWILNWETIDRYNQLSIVIKHSHSFICNTIVYYNQGFKEEWIHWYKLQSKRTKKKKSWRLWFSLRVYYPTHLYTRLWSACRQNQCISSDQFFWTACLYFLYQTSTTILIITVLMGCCGNDVDGATLLMRLSCEEAWNMEDHNRALQTITQSSCSGTKLCIVITVRCLILYVL